MMDEPIQHNTAVCYGELLWDVLPGGAKPGGAPLNVAYHLTRLGVDASLISKVGNDAAGMQLLSLLDQWGLDKSFVQTDNDYPTSEVTVTLNNHMEASYDILYPVAWDFILPDTHLERRLNAAAYLVYGSLSSRNGQSRDSLFALLDYPLTKVMDMNLREPYVVKEDLHHLLSRTDIVKFNQAELKRICSMFGGLYLEENDKAAFIQDTFQINELIVTKGGNGASCYNSSGCFHATGPKILVKDTVGSGDAFLAAFIAGKHNKQDGQDNLDYAVAMGAYTATFDGGCPHYTLADFEEFKSQLFN